ncbi:SusC/RagA family TonB-linked outer membrane protein [Flavobacterium davisii]|uniref:SusC/RagA family TonB-linked outer membrane protein n=1 Tax=Flavobacterium davisii TaxID=2906077 RepID=UPI000B4D4D1F|nr:SusC/RagA family TonB-linked outer membrane protein [Flavobacterium davisii]
MRSKFKWIYTLLIVLTVQFSFAQEKTITGVVTDASGPLPGVNVLVKGTQRGASTGFDGKYNIKAKEGETLIFSFMGMKEISKVIGTSAVMNTVMQNDSKVLADVVVTAVGITKKNDAITTSNQVVKAKELTQAANPNVVQSLIGKVSGLQINTTSNGVNSTTRIVSRGNRSITGNNQMLVVIDNVISSAQFLQQLPPDLIDSANIIKGAQGSALYGELGSNGVIIVTTKKGSKSEKMTVSVNSAIDFESVNYLPQVQDKYGQGWDGHFYKDENGSWGELFDGSIKPVGQTQHDGTQFTTNYSFKKENIRQFFKTGTILQNGISLNVGGDKSYAAFTYGRQNTDFMIDGDKLTRNTFMFKGGKSFGKFKIEGNFNYINQNTEQTSPLIYESLLQTAGNIPVEMFKNSTNDEHWTIYYRSPYWRLKNERFNDKVNTLNSILSLNYEFSKNFNINYAANIRNTSTDSMSFRNAFVGNDSYIDGGGNNVISNYYNSKANNFSFYGDLLLNFNYDLSEALNFKANIGNNIIDNDFGIISQGGTGLITPGFYHISNVSKPDVPSTLDNRNVRNRKIAFFGNFDFNYEDYLFLNASIRTEKSSVLVYNHISRPFYTYPSAGISFVPTKAFASLKDNSILNYTKISLNFARTGNTSAVAPNSIEDYMLVANNFPFNGNLSYTTNTRPVNPEIQPEFVNSYEAALNLGLFNDRITLGAAAYRSYTDNLITFQPLGASTGLISLQDNIGKMHTTGFEIDLGLTPIKTKSGFIWNLKTSYTTSKSIIDELKGGAKEVPITTNTVAGIFAEVGEEFPLIKGTTYQRDPQGRVIVDEKTGLPQRNSQFSKLGKSTPDFIIGLTNSFEFKGLKFTTVVDYRTGHQFYSDVKRELAWSGRLIESADFDRNIGFIYPNSVINKGTSSNPVYVENTNIYTGGVHAAPNGSDNSYTNTISYYSGNYDRTGENLVLNASAFKIRELSLSYSLPEKMLKGTMLTSLRVGVNARNPFVILASDNKGYADPETSSNNGNGVGFANLGQYPNSRTFGGSLNLSF